MSSNKLYFIRRQLYRLKRDYGGSLDFYHITSEIQNLQTGQKELTKVKYHVKRAIIMPINIATYLLQPGAYRKPDANIPPMGMDIGKNVIIIDEKDMPEGIDVTTGDYLVIDHKKYEINTIRFVQQHSSWYITTTETEGADPFEIFEINISQKLIFDQVVSTL